MLHFFRFTKVQTDHVEVSYVDGVSRLKHGGRPGSALEHGAFMTVMDTHTHTDARARTLFYLNA